MSLTNITDNKKEASLGSLLPGAVVFNSLGRESLFSFSRPENRDPSSLQQLTPVDSYSNQLWRLAAKLALQKHCKCYKYFRALGSSAMVPVT